MGLLDAFGSRSREQQLERELNQALAQEGHLEESLAVLEDALMGDPEWRRSSALLEHEFSRSALDRMVDVSRSMYLAHPLVQRGVNVTGFYTWGQGVSFVASDEKVQAEVVDRLMADRGNRAELFGHQARLLTDVDQMIEGNTFSILKTLPNGDVQIRSAPTREIRDIFHVPGDKQQRTFYLREWVERELAQDATDATVTQETMRRALYPDWTYRPTDQPPQIAGLEVKWDEPIAHLRTGGTKQMMFGVPETYAALEWARAYKKFLEDWHSLVSSLSRFAWKASGKPGVLGKMKRRLGSTLPAGAGKETNRQAPAGAVALTPEGADLTPIPKTGASVDAEDARPSRLMVASVFNLPDTILSADADVGTLATAKSLDRPTELAMRSRQMLWAGYFQDIFTYAVWAKQKANRLPDSVDPQVDVSFPPILEHDVRETVLAIIAAATLDGKIEAGTMPPELVSRLMMEALGVEDIEEALAKIGDRERDELEDAIEGLKDAVAGIKRS